MTNHATFGENVFSDRTNFEVMKEVMKKIYIDTNVYDSAVERIDYILTQFGDFYVSISGGKDSSLLLQLVIDRAKLKNLLPVKVLFIDHEAVYPQTIKHIEDLLVDNPDVEPIWICLPFEEESIISINSPVWFCWDEDNKDDWIRPMPKHSFVINQHNQPLEMKKFYTKNMADLKWKDGFKNWMSMKSRGCTADIIGLRSAESNQRIKAIKKRVTKSMFRNKPWTTMKAKTLYNTYPIYDWKTDDVWLAIYKFGYKYNTLYNDQYRAGLANNSSRGDHITSIKGGISLFQIISPQYWNKIVKRVPDMNMGAKYGGTKMYGTTATKPDHLTWREYTNFLLNTLPRWMSELFMFHINIYIRWARRNRGLTQDQIPDVEPPKDHPSWFNKSGFRYSEYPTWKYICEIVLRNDINGDTRRLSNKYDKIKMINEYKERFKE